MTLLAYVYIENLFRYGGFNWFK